RKVLHPGHRRNLAVEKISHEKGLREPNAPESFSTSNGFGCLHESSSRAIGAAQKASLPASCKMHRQVVGSLLHQGRRWKTIPAHPSPRTMITSAHDPSQEANACPKNR